MNYPRRQQYRRLGRAVATGAGGLLAAGGALLAVAQGALGITLVLLLAAVSLGAYARHWSRLAARSRVGARSEEQRTARTGGARSRGLGLTALAALAEPRRHRQRGDRADRDRVRDRDKDQEIRRSARRPGARDGQLAPGSPSPMVPTTRTRGPVRGPRQTARARRSRGVDRVARPAGRSATDRGRHSRAPDLPREPASPNTT